MRKTSTPQEKTLWSRLRNDNLGCGFRRQHSIGRFIADFYCAEKKLVIELDGHQHADNKEYDKERTELFESFGIKVIRFWNEEVDENIKKVVLKIVEELNMINTG